MVIEGFGPGQDGWDDCFPEGMLLGGQETDQETMSSAQCSSAPGGVGQFATTRWSLVVRVKHQDYPSEARRALEELCRIYWYPLYAFVRRQGCNAHDAQDLTQEFFRQLIEKQWLGSVERGRGRFRSFLLVAIRHFLANEWDRARAQKRGGGAEIIALDALTAEQRYALEPADAVTPEKLFERRWALEILNQSLQRLRGEFEASGRGRIFEELKPTLTGDAGASYAEIGERLHASESAVKAAAHRLRQRYREVIRAEIAETVEDPTEIDDELEFLFAALGG